MKEEYHQSKAVKIETHITYRVKQILCSPSNHLRNNPIKQYKSYGPGVVNDLQVNLEPKQSQIKSDITYNHYNKTLIIQIDVMLL
jgi:hypothetical protein